MTLDEQDLAEHREAAHPSGYEVTALVEEGIRVAVPLAVAAELRWLAAQLDIVSDPLSDRFQKGETAGRREVHRLLVVRADELDPPASGEASR